MHDGATGQQDHPADARGLQLGQRAGRVGVASEQEHRVHAVQSPAQAAGLVQVPADRLNTCGQPGR